MMRAGKLPENILKRSVLKPLGRRRKELIYKAAPGIDGNGIRVSDDMQVMLSTNVVEGCWEEVTRLAVPAVVNNLAALFADPVAVMPNIMAPESTEEADLKQFMRSLEAECKALSVEICGGHTQITSAVCRPVISLTGIGRSNRAGNWKDVTAGNQLVMTKWAGIRGTWLLARDYEAELRQKYNQGVVDTALEMIHHINVLSEARIAAGHQAIAMHDVSGAGVFAALWEAASAAGRGVQIDLKRIPLKQETVEICEFLDVNPYQLSGSGALLIACADGGQMVEALESAGIPACVIGHFTEGNDKVLLNEEETRFLEPPRADEIDKKRKSGDL